MGDPLVDAILAEEAGQPPPSQLARLRKQPWYGEVNRIFNAAGVSTFAWEHNAIRESGGNPQAVGDGGRSHGLFQFNFAGGMGSGLEAKYGRKKALEMAKDPIRSAHLIAAEARRQGVHEIPDEKTQAFEFTRKVERPAVQIVERTRRELLGARQSPVDPIAASRQRIASMTQQAEDPLVDAILAEEKDPLVAAILADQAGPAPAPARKNYPATAAAKKGQVYGPPLPVQERTRGANVYDWAEHRTVRPHTTMEKVGRAVRGSFTEHGDKLKAEYRKQQEAGTLPRSPMLATEPKQRQAQLSELRRLESLANRFQAEVIDRAPQSQLPKVMLPETGAGLPTLIASNAKKTAPLWGQFGKWAQEKGVTLTPAQQAALPSLAAWRQMRAANQPGAVSAIQWDTAALAADVVAGALTGGGATAGVRLLRAGAGGALAGAVGQLVSDVPKNLTEQQRLERAVTAGGVGTAVGLVLPGAAEAVRGVGKAVRSAKAGRVIAAGKAARAETPLSGRVAEQAEEIAARAQRAVEADRSVDLSIGGLRRPAPSPAVQVARPGLGDIEEDIVAMRGRGNVPPPTKPAIPEELLPTPGRPVALPPEVAPLDEQAVVSAIRKRKPTTAAKPTPEPEPARRTLEVPDIEEDIRRARGAAQAPPSRPAIPLELDEGVRIGDRVIYTASTGRKISAKVTAVHPDGTVTVDRFPKTKIAPDKVQVIARDPNAAPPVPSPTKAPVPTAPVRTGPKVGDVVYHPETGEALVVTDISDPSLLKVKNSGGVVRSIGRAVALTEPPKKVAATPPPPDAPPPAAAAVTQPTPPPVRPAPVAVAPRAAEPPAPAKEPWEMTSEEAVDRTYPPGARVPNAPNGASADLNGQLAEKQEGFWIYRNVALGLIRVTDPRTAKQLDHQYAVTLALREGKPVPAAVLAEYPDLAAKAPSSAPAPHMMTVEQFQAANPTLRPAQASVQHRKAVEEALRSGEPVPDAVKKQYPSVVSAVKARLDAMEASARAGLSALVKETKGGGLRSGIGPSPEDVTQTAKAVALLSKLAVARTARRALTFGEWSAQMVAEQGEWVKPHLREAWEQAAKTGLRGAARPPVSTAEPAGTPARRVLKPATPPAAPPPPTTPGAAGAAPAKPPADMVGSLNMRYVPDDPDLKQFLRDTYTGLEAEATSQRRGVRSWETTEKAAERLIKEEVISLEKLKRRGKGRSMNAEELRATGNLMIGLAERTKDAAEAVGRSTVDDSAEAMARLTMARLESDVTFLAYQGAATEAGRALNILRKMKEAYHGAYGGLKDDSIQARAREKLKKLMGEAGITPEQLTELRGMDDPVEIAKWLRDQQQLSRYDALKLYYISSLTSGVKTHMRNFVGTGVMHALRVPNKTFTAAYDTLAAPLRGRSREYFFREAVPGTVAYRAGLRAGLKDFAHTLKHGLPTEAAERLEVASRELPGGAKNPLNLNLRMMGAEDAFHKGVFYHVGLHARATRQGMKEGLRGTALKKRIVELLDDEALKDAAWEEAKEYTFNADADDLLRKVMAVKEASRIGFVFVPFLKTPWNIAKSTFAHSPLGFITAFRKELGGDVSAAEAFGKAMTGSLIMAMVAKWAHETEITGEAPIVPASRAAFYESGRRPYSIRIGGRWYSYQSLGNITPLLAVVAAWKDQYWRKNKPTPTEQWLKAAATAVKAFTDQSALSGISMIDDAIDAGMEAKEKAVVRYAARQTTAWLPLSGLLRNIADATDPLQRRPETFRENVKKAIPGLATTVPPRQDVFGRPVPKDPAGWASMNPFIGPRGGTDPVRAELNRLKIFPGFAQKKLTIDQQEVELTPAEHREYQLRVGREMYAEIKKWMGENTYRRESLEGQKKWMEDAIRGARDKATADFKKRLLEQRGTAAGAAR